MVDEIKRLVPAFLDMYKRKSNHIRYYFNSNFFCFVEEGSASFYLRFYYDKDSWNYYFLRDATWDTNIPTYKMFLGSKEEIVSFLSKTVQDSEEW